VAYTGPLNEDSIVEWVKEHAYHPWVDPKKDRIDL